MKNNMTVTRYVLVCGVATLGLLTSCGDHDHDHDHNNDNAHSHAHESEQAGVVEAAPNQASNRIATGEMVRRNLGITFAKAEYRIVAGTIRLPGKFVTVPQAERHFHGPLRGRVDLKVSVFQRVEAGAILYELDAPAWRELQAELAERSAAVLRTQAAVSVALAERAQAERMLTTLNETVPMHKVRMETLDAKVALWQQRVADLEAIQKAGGGRAQDLTAARASLVEAQSERASGAEHQAEHLLEHARVDAALHRQGDAPARLSAAIDAARADKDAAEATYAVALQRAAALTELSVDALLEQVDVQLGQTLTPDSGKIPRWRSIDRLAIRANQAGVISEVTVANGTWIDEQNSVMTLLDPKQVRFDGAILQSDLKKVKAGQKVAISAPAPAAPNDVIQGTLMVGPQADPQSRTVPIVVSISTLTPWARPGVSTVAEIIVIGGDEELAIPLAAIAQDEVKKIIFRRDPDDPDHVIRIDADIGIHDGKWAVVNSGLKEGDEVVLDGIYELVLSGGGQSKGGHFHADGTFHADPD